MKFNITALEQWECTPILRWRKPDDGILAMMQAAGTAHPALQQKWFRHGDMQTEWRDVPTQQEGEE